MDEVLEYCRSGEPFPPRAFAITFDDGFANSATVAAPILSDLRVPSAFYITTRLVDENAMAWIDRIEWVLEREPSGQMRFAWSADDYEFNRAEDKIRILDEIRGQVKSDPSCRPDEVVSSVFSQLGVPEVEASEDPLDRKMTWGQVRQLADADGLTVSGHPHSHAVLSFLDPAALDEEVDTSLILLRERAGLTVRHDSYPEGLAHRYSENVIAVLKERGIQCCPTAEDGLNRAGHDPFRLKRILVD